MDGEPEIMKFGVDEIWIVSEWSTCNLFYHFLLKRACFYTQECRIFAAAVRKAWPRGEAFAWLLIPLWRPGAFWITSCSFGPVTFIVFLYGRIFFSPLYLSTLILLLHLCLFFLPLWWFYLERILFRHVPTWNFY